MPLGKRRDDDQGNTVARVHEIASRAGRTPITTVSWLEVDGAYAVRTHCRLRRYIVIKSAELVKRENEC